MADEKQIIVDGIDVSKCKHHRKCILPDNIGCEIDDFLCCDKPNCDYKQLVRKTQECEQKEKELLSNERIINKLMKEVDELKQECEELKEKLEKFYTLAGEPIEYFLDHYTNLCEDFLLDDRDEDDNTIPILEQIRDRLEDKDTLEEENTRYRKALEEIEGYCNNVLSFTAVRTTESDILDIISKAKGTDNGLS